MPNNSPCSQAASKRSRRTASLAVTPRTSVRSMGTPPRDHRAACRYPSRSSTSRFSVSAGAGPLCAGIEKFAVSVQMHVDQVLSGGHFRPMPDASVDTARHSRSVVAAPVRRSGHNSTRGPVSASRGSRLRGARIWFRCSASASSPLVMLSPPLREQHPQRTKVPAYGTFGPAAHPVGGVSRPCMPTAPQGVIPFLSAWGGAGLDQGVPGPGDGGSRLWTHRQFLPARRTR
jgi:hypothetical protein